MPNFEVVLQEYYDYTLEIEASSEEEAIDKAWDKLYANNASRDEYESGGNYGESFAVKV